MTKLTAEIMARSSLYFIIHKPYGILSQYSDEGEQKGLRSLFTLPPDVYPVGRLDRDSEGLLILTNDKALNNRLLNPKYGHARTYWVEVDGVPTQEALNTLQNGVEINLKGQLHHTAPCKAHVLSTVPNIAERNPPVNRIKHQVTCWLELTLTEGKNRQVRRMTAQIGHPTLRLIRVRIEDVFLGEMPVGGITQLSKKVIYAKLKLN